MEEISPEPVSSLEQSLSSLKYFCYYFDNFSVIHCNVVSPQSKQDQLKTHHCTAPRAAWVCCGNFAQGSSPIPPLSPYRQNRGADRLRAGENFLPSRLLSKPLCSLQLPGRGPVSGDDCEESQLVRDAQRCSPLPYNLPPPPNPRGAACSTGPVPSTPGGAAPSPTPAHPLSGEPPQGLPLSTRAGGVFRGPAAEGQRPYPPHAASPPQSLKD